MVKGAYRKVTGWAQIREQGGTNSLSLNVRARSMGASCVCGQAKIKEAWYGSAY